MSTSLTGLSRSALQGVVRAMAAGNPSIYDELRRLDAYTWSHLARRRARKGEDLSATDFNSVPRLIRLSEVALSAVNRLLRCGFGGPIEGGTSRLGMPEDVNLHRVSLTPATLYGLMLDDAEHRDLIPVGREYYRVRAAAARMSGMSSPVFSCRPSLPNTTFSSVLWCFPQGGGLDNDLLLLLTDAQLLSLGAEPLPSNHDPAPAGSVTVPVSTTVAAPATDRPRTEMQLLVSASIAPDANGALTLVTSSVDAIQVVREALLALGVPVGGLPVSPDLRAFANEARAAIRAGQLDSILRILTQIVRENCPEGTIAQAISAVFPGPDAPAPTRRLTFVPEEGS